MSESSGYGENGVWIKWGRTGYEVIQRWLHTLRVTEEMGQNTDTVICLQEGPAS